MSGSVAARRSWAIERQPAKLSTNLSSPDSLSASIRPIFSSSFRHSSSFGLGARWTISSYRFHIAAFSEVSGS